MELQTLSLDVSRIKELDEALAAFPFSLLQDFITFGKHCKEMGIEVEEVVAYIRLEVKETDDNLKRMRMRRTSTEEFIKRAPHCPVCDNVLALEPINDDISRMVDGHSHSWWVCPDTLCNFDPIMTDKFYYEVLSDLGIPVRKPPVSVKRARAANIQRQGGTSHKRRKQP